MDSSGESKKKKSTNIDYNADNVNQNQNKSPPESFFNDNDDNVNHNQNEFAGVIFRSCHIVIDGCYWMADGLLDKSSIPASLIRCKRFNMRPALLRSMLKAWQAKEQNCRYSFDSVPPIPSTISFVKRKAGGNGFGSRPKMNPKSNRNVKVSCWGLNFHMTM